MSLLLKEANTVMEKQAERIAELEAALAQIVELDQHPNPTTWGMTNAVGACARIARAALRKID